MRVCLLFLSLSVFAVSAAARPDPIPALGVLPVRSTGKDKRKNAFAAAEIYQQLVEVLSSKRERVVGLAKGKERALRAASKKSLLKVVRARGDEAGTDRVLASTLTGLGVKQVLEVELFDVTGHSMGKLSVAPHGRASSEWVEQIVVGLGLIPVVRAEVADTIEPGDGSLVPEKLAENFADPTESVVVERAPASWWTVWTVSAVSLGTLSAASFTGGAFAGVSAWEESEALVEMPRGNSERVRLEESSIQKAVLADTLFGTGALLASAALATGVVAAFSTVSE